MRINRARVRNAVTRSLIRMGGFSISPVAIKCRRLGAVLTNEGDHLSLRRDNKVMKLAHKHFIYAPYLSSSFSTFFSPLVPEKIDGDYVLDFSRSGILQTYAKSGLQFEMASFPEEEENIEGYFRWNAPKPGDIIFDVGAHCGVSSYHFSKMVGPSGRVIAFEPDPVNFPLLLRNIDRHKLTNVVPLQIAISGNSGFDEFSAEGTIGASLARHSSHPPISDGVTVETVTLEDAFRRWGNPQFCKIDIEGGEIEVIGAAKEFLKNQQCEFALDTGHKVDGDYTDKRIEKLFMEAGYEVMTETTPEAKTTWANPKTVNLVKTEAGVNAVCPKCEAVIGRFPDSRSAYLNSGKLSSHVC
jgi:FkbM family methyltransferase